MGEYLFIASAIFSIANGIVVLCVNPRRSINKMYFATSLWIAIWLFCVAAAIIEGNRAHESGAATVIFWLRLNASIAAFFGWYLWLMKAVIIDSPQSLRQILRKSWSLFLFCCLVASITWSDRFIPSHPVATGEIRGTAYTIYTGVLTLVGVWLLANAAQKSRRLTGVRRIEMQFLVFTSIGACLLLVISSTISSIFNLSWLRRSGPLFFTSAHALAIWAICYHRVFDAKQIIGSIGQRLLLLGLLGAAALVVDQVLDHYIHNLWSPFLTAIIICAIGIACDGPTRRWFGLDSNHLLLAPRRTIIDWARKVPDEEELKDKFESLLREQCQTSSAILLSSQEGSFSGSRLILPSEWAGFATLCKEGWMTPETLQRSRSAAGTAECAEFMSRHQLGALLAVPKGSFPPSLVVGLGQKASLRPYTFPDIQGLLELAELMDNILTHSRVSAHAARLEKMASATMMSRALAHDLNNLATPVSTFLVHMEGKVMPDTSEAVVLADAKHSLRIMQDYIGESLFFARQLIPHLSLVDAHELLASVVRLSHDHATTIGVRVIVRCGENFTFLADGALLKRTLQNLIFNALDVSQPGDSIEISAFVSEGDQVSLRVSDHRGTRGNPLAIIAEFVPVIAELITEKSHHAGWCERLDPQTRQHCETSDPCRYRRVVCPARRAIRRNTCTGVSQPKFSRRFPVINPMSLLGLIPQQVARGDFPSSDCQTTLRSTGSGHALADARSILAFCYLHPARGRSPQGLGGGR